MYPHWEAVKRCSIQFCIQKKKRIRFENTRVVAPTFVYKIEFHMDSDPAGRKPGFICISRFLVAAESLQYISLKKKRFWPGDLDLWPMTLTWWPWPRYPSTWPTCQNSGLYVCQFGRKRESHTHTHTYTHTHRRTMPKLLHPLLTRGVKMKGN